MPKGKTMADTKWDESEQKLPQPEKKPGSSGSSANEQPYVHTPGTVHLNAYVADVADAEAKLSAAKNELAAAEARLEQKKQESGMI